MRPSIQSVMLKVASALAARGTCVKLQVGCVLLGEDNRILSTGYNGMARGRPHCNEDTPCWGHCQATHAESNAIISCTAGREKIHACYTTHSPCMACCKQLIQTGCLHIAFLYPSSEEEEARDFWLADSYETGRTWNKYAVDKDELAA